MPSAAKSKFDHILSRSILLSDQAGSLRKKSEQPTKLVLLHAALATQVAAWEVYVKNIVSDYFTSTTNATDNSFNSVHTLLRQRMTESAKKLNTPNSHKSRDFFIEYTGFDPIPHWSNVKFGSTLFTNSLMTRERMDEIFKVRHSFAHGITMPMYAWNANSHGAHLDCKVIHCCAKFFEQVSRNTDAAFSSHIGAQHSIPKPW